MDDEAVRESLTLLAKLVRNQHQALNVISKYVTAMTEMRDVAEKEQAAGRKLPEIDAALGDFVAKKLREIDEFADSGDETTQALDAMLERLKA
jgi:hypothetical protein